MTRHVLVILLIVFGVSRAMTGEVPFPTGSHRQLVREFFDAPSQLLDVRAIAVLRDGTVLVAAGSSLLRKERDQWQEERGPVAVSSFLVSREGTEVTAGATNGIWLRSNGTWHREESGPVSVLALACEPDGTPWALTQDSVWRRSREWTLVHRTEDNQMMKPRDLLPRGPEEVWLASETGLFGLMGKRKYWLPLEVGSGRLLSGQVRALAHYGAEHCLVATDRGLNITDGKTGWHALTGKQGLPIEDLTRVECAADGAVWLGSDQGLIRWEGGRWTYFASKRWLPNDRVQAIGAASDGSVWVGTPGGLAHIYHQTLTLEEKAAHYQKALEERDRRHGYVTVMHLPKPGVVEGALQEISDNDGLWTALYIAAQSFRHAVTRSPEAKAQAARSMKALLRLESITGISGFPARSIAHPKEPQFALQRLDLHPEFHPSNVEPGWFWKGDTSSDEIDGHYFGWYLFYELAADETEKRAVAATCKRVTDHLLDHNYSLVDQDGRPTTWGYWAPEKLNDDPLWWEERGLNALEILSHLKVAFHLVGEARYQEAYRTLIAQHHYALNTLEAKLAHGVSHDDQLLFLSYYPLLQLEQDPALRNLYVASLERTWQMERLEANPLWNFIYGACASHDCDVEDAVRTLREMPLDFILWPTRNSVRADLRKDESGTELHRSERPLSFTERLLHKWDKDPFLLDGGSEQGECDPTIWLLPYWMGRYHQIIQ